jgi:hypothetical protein
LRELATDGALTLLTASKDPLISEAAVRAELLQELANPGALPGTLDPTIV